MKGFPCVCAIALSVFAILHSSGAADIWWKGGPNLDWNNPLSWEGGSVPGPGNTAKLGWSQYTKIDLGSGITVKNLQIAPRQIWSGPSSYFQAPSVYTIGIGPAGSQTLTLLDGGFISGGEDRSTDTSHLTINAKLVLGENGEAGAYKLYEGTMHRNYLTVNGPITGGSGGVGGAKTLLANQGGGDIYTEKFFNGVISDGGAASLSVTTRGVVHFAAQNTYSGESTFFGGKIYLEVANAISAASAIFLQGADLRTGNFDQNFGSLSLDSGGTFTFESGYVTFNGGIITFEGITSAVTFKDSHLSLWNGILNVDSFRIGQNTLRFGTDSSGLTADQLSRIVKSGYTAGIDDHGYIVFTPVAVPEPGAAALLGLGLGVIGIGLGRRKWNL